MELGQQIYYRGARPLPSNGGHKGHLPRSPDHLPKSPVQRATQQDRNDLATRNKSYRHPNGAQPFYHHHAAVSLL